MANTQQQGQGPAPRHPPCAACKLQRKKCLEKCELAPYFPPSRYEEFRAAYKIYGVSNIQKMLAIVPPDQRQIAADSLIAEGTARMNDPVHGSLGIIRDLKEQIKSHRLQLEALNQQLAFYKETEMQSDLMTNQTIQEDDQSVCLGVPVPFFPHVPREVMAEMRRYEQGYIYYSNLKDGEDQEENFDINLIQPVFESDLKRNAKSCFSGPGESSAAAAAVAPSAASNSKEKGKQPMGM